MKSICFVRHAKASQLMSELSDIDRPLIDRGYKDAHSMSHKLVAIGFNPQTMISSTGIRAITTALIFARNLRFPASQIILDSNLYNASVEQITEVIAELPDQFNTAMIFGHNPSITNVINFFVNDFVEHIPTCGMACIDFQMNSWKKAAPRSSHLRFFQHPKSV